VRWELEGESEHEGAWVVLFVRVLPNEEESESEALFIEV
jgi:hypothetical protein